MKRTLVTALTILTLATGLFAQRGPGGRGGRGGDPVAALKTALGLTDAQVTAITSLLQAEQTRMEAIRTEIEQRRQELDTLLNTTAPAAVTVGNAAIALHNAELKMKAERDSFIAQVKQQLTGEQQQKLDALLQQDGGRALLPGLGGPGGRREGPPPRQ